MGRYPEVAAFINNKSKEFTSLKIEYERGADPVLVMRNIDGSDESIAVGQWKEQTFSEFFQAKLKNEHAKDEL